MTTCAAREREISGEADQTVVLVVGVPDDQDRLEDALRVAFPDGVRTCRAGSTDAALAAAAEHRPDCVMVALEQGTGDGVETVARLSEAHPELGIVVVSGSDEHTATLDAVARGAHQMLGRSELLGPATRRSVTGAMADCRHAAEDARAERIMRHSREVLLLLDRAGRLVWASPSFVHVTGYDPTPLIGRGDRLDLSHPDDARRIADAVADVCAGRISSTSMEYRGRQPDGGWCWRELVITDQRDDPVLDGVVLNLRDVSARRKAEEELRFQADLLTSVGQPVVATHADGTVRFWNQAATDLFGWTRDEAVGRPVNELTTTAEEWSWLVARMQTPDPAAPVWSGEVRMRRKDGSFFAAQLTTTRLFDDDGGLAGTIGVTTDLTATKAAERELLHQARHDALTGLPNRTWLTERLQQVLDAADPEHDRVRVALLDLDQFKVVNDSLGHVAGDHVLQAVAARVRAACAAHDLVGRFGGDEYVVVRHERGTRDDLGAGLGALLRDAFAEPVRVDDREFRLTASIGIATGEAGSTPDTLIRDADVAMFEAKARGKNRYAFFDATLSERTRRRLALEADLRGALQADQLHLVHQPVVDLTTGTTVGFEALLRWDHPTLGVVEPTEFIPIAEDSGVIGAIGDWVLETATCTLARWRRDGVVDDAVWVAVNLSARQLADHGLVETVSRVLARCDLPAANLHLEITESVLMDDVEHAVELTRALSNLGCPISIDDFGTGYSSLAYLRRLPVRAVKVDRSFVLGMGRSRQDEAIVASVVALARALDLDVVAEGVEHQDQRRILESLRCTYAQGYLWSGPLLADAVPAWLAQSVVPV